MTLAELALTVGLLGVLGVVAGRFGMSAIPAYLLAGIILGPNEPEFIRLISPSEVTEFVAEIGLVFLLFFLGLEFSLGRLLRAGRHVALGGTIDLAVNLGIGLLVGLVAFGAGFGAFAIAIAIYVSSSAIVVKGLIDFRRLADDETDLVLAILVFEDLVLAFALGFVGSGGGGEAGETAALAGRRWPSSASRSRPRAGWRRSSTASCSGSTSSSSSWPCSASSSGWPRSPSGSASPRRSAR
jgi:CPA2 family monovalent cation:H+ antiporter-2